MKPFTLNQLRKFLKESLFVGLLLSLSVYAWVRALLFEVPFSISEDGMVIAKAIGTGWLLIITIRLSWYLLLALAEKIQQLSMQPFIKTQWAVKLIIGITLSTILFACNAQVGVSKNINTGMVTSYKGISTGETKMIMNNEELNHADIPIGESFVIVNDDVKGLTVKNGKVSVGCSLTITDKNGNPLLSEPDLFKANDVFEKIDYLKCTVNTGAPMKWEEKYKVHVVFTDKYGTGKIENDVFIRMIDVP